MRREDSVAPATSNTTWLAPTLTRSSPAPSFWPTIRASSASARAGTLASNEPSSALSRRVSLTERRYESVATIRSSWPDAVTRMPVRMGRVSSREALRCTRVTVSTNAPPGTETTASPAASGKGGKSSARSVRMWEGGEVVGPEGGDVEGARPGDALDVLLARTVLERHALGRQGADHVEEEPRRQHDGAVARHLALAQGDAQPDLHVGGAQLRAVLGGLELDAGQRLHG